MALSTYLTPSVLQVQARWPGVLVCVVIALAATFLTDHYGGPQLLYALLIGLALHFLMADPRLAAGVNFCARTALRLGVALLGLRITWDQVAHLGWRTALVIALAVVLTISFGLLVARSLGRSREEGLLSGCAVGICGASAALAVASVLPATRENERFTLLTVVGVTLLSTLAMVVYPFGLQLLHMSSGQGAVFLGGTIHDVAQVVAAGMMLGPDGGEKAALVKLLRVLMLLPVVLVVAALYRQASAKVKPTEGGATTAIVGSGVRPPLLPTFLVGFVVLMTLASLGWIPPRVTAIAGDASRWLLVVAIAAAGVKTTFEELLSLGWRAVAMLVAETVFIAAFVLGAILLLGLGAQL